MTAESDAARDPLVLKLFRWLFRFAVGAYFVAAIAVLALRYAVLPRIDEWRPRIEAMASRMLDAPVSIGRIQADWQGLHPRLKFDGLRIDDADGRAMLTAPRARATLAWRSVLMLSPQLLSLEVFGLDLSARRDGHGRLWLAGRELPAASGGDGGSKGLRWLLAQRELVVRDATLRWTDELRGAPQALVLTDASLLVRNTLLGSRLAFAASPPAAYATRLSFRADLARSLLALDRDDPKAWSGQVYAQLDDASPAAWRPWLDLPDFRGRLAARVWLDIDHGEPASAAADMAVRGLDWRIGGSPDGVRIRADALDARLEGSPGDLLAGVREPFAAATRGESGIAARMTMRGAALDLPGVFDQPVPALDTLSLDFSVAHPGPGDWTVLMRQLTLSNPDLSAQLQGVWRSAGRTLAGTLDMNGQVSRLSVNALHRYLPRDMDADARDWLRVALVAGQAGGMAVAVRGDLGDFPFAGQPPGAGQFRLAGSFRDAVIDYSPPVGSSLGWPRLEQAAGTFDIERAALKLRLQSGKVRTGEQSRVTLERLSADIPDLEHSPTLHLDGETSGQAVDYLAMMRQSPLGELLDHQFDEMRGAGVWRVPLRLTVPLMDVDRTTVRGKVVFDGGRVRLRPDAPELSGLKGALGFTDEGVSAEGLQGRFLGGPLRASGELTRRGDGLRLDGTVRAEALQRQWPMPAMRRFSGQADYAARLIWRPSGAVDLLLESPLTGLAIDLPAPLGKPAQAPLPLKASWGPGRDGMAGRWLDVRLGEVADALLELAPAPGGAVFRRGGLGVHRAAPQPAQGLALDLSAPSLDVAAWDRAVAEFSLPQAPGGKPGRPLLPALTEARVRSASVRLPFMVLRDVELDARRSGETWQTALQSREAAGSWTWREPSPQAPGRLAGRFDHLALGDAGGKPEDGERDDLFTPDQALDFPDVSLEVGRLSLYGRDLGALSLSGANAERGARWRIDGLKLANADARLTGRGLWRLSGESRGLELDLSLDVADLGRLMTRLGHGGRVAGGKGEMTGKLAWRNLPWQHRYIDLEGTLSLSLEKGVFARLNSHGARLLELLSLQSVERLARLDVDPGAMFRDGFRFDSIRSALKITHGTVHTEGVKIDSPVAAILLAGDTNLTSRNWNLEAAVVPKLDASGAAIAAGIVVNPLVGLGALLTQWILKEPLARAMTARYAVTGTWDEPVLAPLGEAVQPRRRVAEEQPGH